MKRQIMRVLMQLGMLIVVLYALDVSDSLPWWRYVIATFAIAIYADQEREYERDAAKRAVTGLLRQVVYWRNKAEGPR